MSESLQNTRVVLCETSHAGNIGAAARAMRTMGLETLMLVNPKPGAHLSHEAVRRASRASPVLEAARMCASLDEALSGVVFAVACSARLRGLAVPALEARAAVQRLAAVAVAQPVALVFGNETSGLSTEQVNRCQLQAYIPTDAQYGSLNLAAAVQVMTYEFRLAVMDAPVASSTPRELATHEELEALYTHLEQEFLATGFINPTMPGKLMDRLRRLFARAELDHEEVNILRGAVRSFRYPKKR